MASTSSSANFFGMRDEDQNQIKLQQSSATNSSTVPLTTALKKKRNLPGTPNPDAEVIALSPRTLMATNRFICEVCNKGFQREQNLQLHRRGHNLPWKLKQKSTKEVKRKVYLCPEPTCVHHDPSRALGDLTGIKKHFCRKHGEKKWKCDKCSKKYAVQSDWKAHTKTCGTREYRCDCGTLFSRRDSFITHRAFCDALAQESARLPPNLNTIGGHLYGNNNMNLASLNQVGSQISSLQEQNHPSSSDLLRLGGSHFDPSTFRSSHSIPSSSFYLPNSNQEFNQEHQSQNNFLQNKALQSLIQLSDLQNNSTNPSSSSSANNLFNLGFFNNNGNNNSLSSSGLLVQDPFNNGNDYMNNQIGHGVSSVYNSQVQNESIVPQMSATALLQKAAQMGSTTSSHNATFLRGLSSSGKTERSLVSGNYRGNFPNASDGNIRSQVDNQTNFQEIVNSLTNANSSVFGEDGSESGFGNFNSNRVSLDQQHCSTNISIMDELKLQRNLAGSSIGVGSDKLTRDFLGVSGMIRNVSGGISQRSQQQQQQHGMNTASIDSELKSAAPNRGFNGGSFR